VKHRDQIDNPAGSLPQGVCDGLRAAAAVKRAQWLQAAVRLGHQAISLSGRLGCKMNQLPKKFGIEAGHVAGDDQVPLGGVFRTESGFHAREWTAIRGGIGDSFEAEMTICSGVSNQTNRIGGLAYLLRYMLPKSGVAVGQQSFIVTHAQAFSPHKNEARHAGTRNHLRMISLEFLTRRLRFAPCTFALLVAAPVLMAEAVGTRTTISVKTDARTGRLVRSVVVSPRPVVLPAALQSAAGSNPVDHAIAQTIAEGSISDMIDAIAEQNQVEAPLVHSVIKAESNYNPAALSPKGAQGLMQLIPSTARRFGVSNSFNIQQNIEGGVKYLKFLMNLYQNDYVKVIAAYNAGEGAVAKYGGIPPYAETINYVYRVGKNLKTARQFAEIKAAEKIAKVPVQTASHAPGTEEPHPIQAITGDDGRVYYKTQ
jgi:hypothetical protein